MAIFKAKYPDKFVLIPNATIQDNRLSWEARGLLSFILSQSESFEIHKAWLVKQVDGCGRDKMTRMLRELQDLGYCQKKAKLDENGKLNGVDWFVYSEPVLTTEELVTRTTGYTSDVKPATTKEKDILNKNKRSSCRQKFSDDDLRLAEWIRDLLASKSLISNPDKKNMNTWAEDVRKMRALDHRTHRQIAELLSWASSDPFWQGNILSPKKLRTQWDQLTIKRGLSNGANNPASTNKLGKKQLSVAERIEKRFEAEQQENSTILDQNGRTVRGALDSGAWGNTIDNLGEDDLGF